MHWPNLAHSNMKIKGKIGEITSVFWFEKDFQRNKGLISET